MNAYKRALRQCRVADAWRLQTGRMHFSIFLVQNPGHTLISMISVTKLTGDLL